jgi:mRNA-degrading endonuclease RelE of RelBE toxin-antitoxin system
MAWKVELSQEADRQLDKLDPHSFEMIGDVVMKSIGELERQK